MICGRWGVWSGVCKYRRSAAGGRGDLGQPCQRNSIKLQTFNNCRCFLLILIFPESTFCLSALVTAKLAVLSANLEKTCGHRSKTWRTFIILLARSCVQGNAFIRIPPRLCSINIFCMFVQYGFHEKLEDNHREYTNFSVQHSGWQSWVWLGPALGKSYFSSFSRP